eukprot:COSAG06_NODE_1973_length_7938_cov_3.557852_6_plen_222_part_00
MLSEIWRAVPMAVVSKIPLAFAEEGKLRDILSQFGPVDAVRFCERFVSILSLVTLEKNVHFVSQLSSLTLSWATLCVQVGIAVDKDKSWALVTFRHETSIKKAVAQPVEAGTELLHVERAQFQQVVDMNNITVQEQRGWDPNTGKPGGPGAGGLVGAMAGTKGGAAGGAAKEVRETPEEVAARLNRSFKVRDSTRRLLVYCLAARLFVHCLCRFANTLCCD